MQINWITVAIGAVSAAYGAYTFWARKNTPEKFAKLAKMRKFYGEKIGTAVHTLGYTVLPLVIGCVLVYLGLRGVSLFN